MSKPNFDDAEMQEIFEGFLVETKELLDNITQDLMDIENQPDDLELINKIFRSFHTIKGTSSFMGLEKITEITHHAEDILNKLRKNEFKMTQEITDVLFDVHDWIIKIMDKINTDEYENLDYGSTIEIIEKLKKGKTDDIPEQTYEAISVNPVPEQKDISISNAEVNQNVNALNYLLENKDNFKNDGEMTEDDIALFDKAFKAQSMSFVNESTGSSGSKNEPVNQIKNDVSKSNVKPVESNNKSQKSNQANQNQAAETIRIDVSRVEALMDLSGELVLGRNRLAQITSLVSKISDKNKDIIQELIGTTTQIDFITSEIQATVMRMRMVQIGKLYQKAPRIVRDLSKEFNKKIKLILKGEETELDKSIIEELNDPLVHMIRNSCDHGIESAEIRKATGKSEEGTITIDSYQEGNNIVIKISDDGKGIDVEKIKEKALEKGLINSDQALQMSNRDILQLIFAPGFSTANVVSSVSGRGVGMDVVITNIRKLKGTIDVETEVGYGSTFTIKLPLTLAIIQGLLIKSADETYAIPLATVEEVVAIEKENIHLINQKEFIKIRSNVLPLIRLDDTLNLLKGNDLNKENRSNIEGKYVVVVGLDIQRLGIVVDDLLGQQEIVIKSIGEYLGHIPGIAGSTILGDGRVIMIIDIGDLMSERQKLHDRMVA